jgi:hypothetical protein
MPHQEKPEAPRLGRRPLLQRSAMGLLACALGETSQAFAEGKKVTGHPRLYFTPEEVPKLRRHRATGMHARIWKNLRASADECLKLTPRRAWIAPVTPDPIYENLYDRFYAMMGDLAVTEHLSFAYSLSGDEKYGQRAKEWALASCRAWQKEAEGEPDGGKAYAVCRLLKGLAVAYDCLHSLCTAAERKELRETLVRIGGQYYGGYFTTPTIAGETFHTHHAVVEWASFGVAALALLGEHPAAQEWLNATVAKFQRDLLPRSLEPDGAQIEGSTFWASTMQYRLFFMDPLRRITGQDLYTPFRAKMNADLALASIAAEKRTKHDQDHETVVLEPSYGQLNYYAPVLLALAREYRRPLYQHLALWDHTLGSLQNTRYVTPSGEVLRFELGGYAYLWYDPTVTAEVSDAPRHYHFPSVGEAYLRESWEPGGVVVGVRKGSLVVHVGGKIVLVELLPGAEAGLAVRRVTDDGTRASIHCEGPNGARLEVELQRPGRLIIRRKAPGNWTWYCDPSVQRKENAWSQPSGVAAATLTLRSGKVAAWEAEGHQPPLAVGNGRLNLRDPLPMKYPMAELAPDTSGEVVLELSVAAKAKAPA